MAKKIIKVQDTKPKKKSSLNLGNIAKVVMENEEAIGKITEGINEIMTGQKTDTKTTKKKKSAKKTTKKTKNSNDSLSTIIDLAGTIFKK